MEILAKENLPNLQTTWLDWTGKFVKTFEFPLADRIQNTLIRRRIYKSNFCRQFLSNHQITTIDSNIPQYQISDGALKNLAKEVAYLELIAIQRDSSPCKKHFTKTLELFEETFIETYQTAYKVLLSEKYNQVILYNGRFLQERAVWEVCLKLEIPVIFYEKFNPSWVNRYYLFKESTHSPSYRSSIMTQFGDSLEKYEPLVLDTVGKKWFEKREQGVSQKYTNRQIKGRILNLPIPYVVFFHSSEDELLTSDLLSDYWGNQLDALRKLIEVITLNTDLHLVIRMHPNLLYKSRREIRFWAEVGSDLQIANQEITFIDSESEIDSYDLIKGSEAVVTVGSTIGVEAAFLKKRSILLGRGFHENMEITSNPKSIHELLELLVKPAPAQELNKAMHNSLKYAVFHELGGEDFEIVTTIKEGDSYTYAFEALQINLSKISAILMRFDSLFRRISPKHRVAENCNSDCEIS
jgi:hypothetical protein